MPATRSDGPTCGSFAERAGRLARLLAQAEQDARQLCLDLRAADLRAADLPAGQLQRAADRSHHLVQDALIRGALELAALLQVDDAQLPD